MSRVSITASQMFATEMVRACLRQIPNHNNLADDPWLQMEMVSESGEHAFVDIQILTISHVSIGAHCHVYKDETSRLWNSGQADIETDGDHWQFTCRLEDGKFDIRPNG